MARSSQRTRATGASGPGRLRIVAGKWRRRLLPVADVNGLRPTPARVRETLFNWLAADVVGAQCIDLCAGTGALGFEALSRGAEGVTFVESSRRAVRALRSAAELLGADNAHIVMADAREWLASAPVTPAAIVFLDPPYREALLPDLCRLLDTRGWLAAGARVYLEEDRGLPAADLPGHWRRLKEATAGNVHYQLLSPGP